MRTHPPPTPGDRDNHHDPGGAFPRGEGRILERPAVEPGVEAAERPRRRPARCGRETGLRSITRWGLGFG